MRKRLPVGEGRMPSLVATALTGLFLLYAATLLFPIGTGYVGWRDAWLGNVVLFAPAVACLAAARLPGPRRPARIWLGVGMLSFAFGNVVYLTQVHLFGESPFPSLADVGYLGFYPCAYAAVLLSVRQDLRVLPRSVLLDSALGAVGAATALAVLLGPVFAGISGSLAVTVVATAYPLGDLLLIAMVAGLLALRGARTGGLWLWLAFGLLSFTTADVIYALRVARDTYTVGTVLDSLWALGLTVMAIGVWRPTRVTVRTKAASMAVLAVPLVSTVVALVVLVVATLRTVSSLAVALATATLVLAVLRTYVSFRQVHELADERRQARTDDLTGLPNRRLLGERLAAAISAPGTPKPMAVLLVDLDRFKEINDSLGHAVGDDVLQLVGPRIADQLRSDDVLARLGGDEFGILLADTRGPYAAEVAERLLTALRRPLELGTVSLRVDASIGVALYPDHADTVGGLLQAADIAMYRAKAARTGFEIYQPRPGEQGRERLDVLEALRRGLERDELVLHYQPKLDLRSGEVVGVEALVRWQHPVRGLLLPDAFLPLAEQSGLMRRLTLVVLETALRQVRRWRADGYEIPVAVNLSATNLLDAELPEQVGMLLDALGLPHSALELEITETVLMADPARARQVLTALRRLGVCFAVDDYGTGYSSLAYLQDLPVDELKLDRSFVTRCATDRRSAAIVTSTIALARSLDMRSVAEGIDSQEVLDELRGAGCDIGQGYHLCPPLPAEQLSGWLDRQRRSAVR